MLSNTEFLDKLYKDLKGSMGWNEKSKAYKYLEEILELSKDPGFVKQLQEYELRALQQSEDTLTYLIFHDLRTVHTHISGQDRTDEKEFHQYLSVVVRLLPLFTKEILDYQFERKLFIRLIGNKHTALSLAVGYLYELQQEDLRGQLKEHEKYDGLIRAWANQVIQYLINLEVDPDKGYIHCYSVLATCLRSALPLADNTFYQLAQQLLARVKDIDRREKPIATAFAIANLRKFPAEFQKAMLAKGANVNILFCLGIFKAHIQESLLTGAIRKKDYERMRFLLQCGADPNQLSCIDEDSFLTTEQKREVCRLTPYQLAVSLGDNTAKLIIVEHCKRNDIALEVKLHPSEQNRSLFFSLGDEHKYKGPDIFIEGRNRLFEENMLTDLYKKFGIKCFVENLSDTENVTAAITWLFEQAQHSSVALFWMPALERFKQEIRESGEFGLYVGDTANQRFKQKSTAADGTTCLGLYHGNVSVQTGLAIFDYIWVIAHEIGHLYDAKVFGFGTLHSIMSVKNELFREAMDKDLNHLEENLSLGDFEIMMDILTISVYPQAQKIKEFFTRVLFQIPMKLAYSNPDLGEEDLMKKMNEYFPNTIQWFLNLTKKPEEERVLSMGK